MHSVNFLLPLAFALSASADPVGTPSVPAGYTPARQFHHYNAHERRDDPEVDPEILCGANYKDCGDGWCCSARQNCAGKIETVPVCKDPTVTYGILEGTEPAMPFDDLDDKLESMSNLLESLTGGPQTDRPRTTGPQTNRPQAEGTQTDGPEADGPANTAGFQETGAAAVNGLNGFGSMAVVVAGLWGIAAMGGAGFLLM
ncbi:hypothetical protein IAQ61_009489 [Plenodomus lingam]|nr:hypothetical protein IAQ61_009489 [Plenodomus lingam]